MIRHFGKFLLTGLLTLALFDCAGTSVTPDDPKALYENVEDDIDSSRYQIALDKLRLIKNKFPYSKYSILAKLRTADVYFLQESYAEAAGSYELFIELHPIHGKVSYAAFRLAESHFQDIPGNIARDIFSASAALKAYQNFTRRFPNDKRAPKAKKRLKQCRNILANKELSIAEFYIHWDPAESALGRFEKIVKHYPDTVAGNTALKRVKALQEDFSSKKDEEVERVNGAVKYRIYEDRQ